MRSRSGTTRDLLARDEGMPFVEDDVDLLVPRASDHQRLGAGRLDDGDLDGDARSAGTRARGAPDERRK